MANIYLSSTFEDLKEHRRTVSDALRELRHDVRQMEHYTASEERPLRECLADVARADVYVGVIAWRYGYVPKDAQLNAKRESITALEYRAARAHGIPTFVFLVDDEAAWPKKWVDKSSKGVDGFRAELKQDLVVGLFQTPDELARKVASSVTNWEKRQAPVKLSEALPGKADDEPEDDSTTWGLVAIGAMKTPLTGAGVTVGLVSTGVDTSHEAFAGIDFAFKDFTGEGDNDPHSYGTHCLATICGRSIGGRRIGVAPGVTRVLLAKVLSKQGGGVSQAVFDGALWAARQGAQIVLVSAGFDYPGLVSAMINRGTPAALAAGKVLDSYLFNLRLFESLAVICSHGEQPCLLVAPSGNESRREVPGFVLSGSLPGGASGFLSVAAVRRLDDRKGFDMAPFSNSGDVAAPGVDVLSAAAGGGLSSMSGTSMAASHAAGVAALWAQKLQQSRGRADTRELAARVRGNADVSRLLPGIGADDVGCGVVQAPPA